MASGDAVIDMREANNDNQSSLTATPTTLSDGEHLASSGDEDGGVDVAKGEAEFSKLRKALSHESKVQSEKGDKDLEAAEEEDDFDLYDYLSSTQSEASKAGIKRKRMGVTWTNLQVEGAASMSLGVKTFPDAITGLFTSIPMMLARMVGINLFNSGSRKLLQNFNGSLQPGEMCLVIGRPGSGCSTFLKTIANQRSGFLGVNGEVLYGGLSSKLFEKRYRGEVVYCEEDDMHFPTLSVEQTLDAALRFKSPGKKLPGENENDFRNRVLTMMLKMLNIEHTRGTKVGSAYVRGVSGGERKRVSIAEVLATRACVLSWDNSSRGLDASTALDYAKSMRLLTNVLGLSTFISLYQAGEGIWEQFDKVLVLDAGRCVYYGPRDQARQYMISQGYADLPRQTSADYCTGCTDKYERRFQEGRNESNVASTAEELEKAYLESDICRKETAIRDEYKERLTKENDAEEFQGAVKDDKHKGVRKSSNYTVSYPKQVYALWIRQVQMLLGDKLDIAISYFTALAIALITGSLFYQLPETAAGAFTRGGVLFIALLFNSLTAFSELPTQMGGRPILYRQSGFCFYRPSALTIAQLAADLPFGVPRIAIFSLIIYFMAGLTVSAGAFFTFLINVLISYYAFRALFALFGTICKNYDVAARLAAGIIIALVLFAGYVIPRMAMKRWLFWISYINPVYYGFEALMVNEFKDLNLACVDTYITPRGDGYPAYVGANQVCTLAGATAGQQSVPGLDYLAASFGFQRNHLWLNFGIQIVFFVGLTAVTCVAIELLQMGSFASALTIKKKPNKEEAKLDARLQARLEGKEEKQDDEKIEVYGRAFTWSELSYTVPVKGGERLLLNKVYGFVKPGQLTALMGASGAGKTTLLDVLADRKSVGKIEGDRLVEGKPVGLDFQRGCGYAEQQDIHEHTATVREALRFSAYLRQPSEVPKEDKDAYVEDIIELLEMQDLANAQIGISEFGLGVADRKRVTIAVELAAKPDQLLFLDEPTSGLDGQGAYTIVRLLKKLAANGQTILCTIHQPNSLLFEQFDRLLLLERGGNTVYFGPVGKDSCHLVDYFRENGAECPEAVNPAEFMLEAVGAGSSKRIGPRDWKDIYLDSKLFQDNLEEIDAINQAGAGDNERGQVKEYSTPFAFQLKTVLRRSMLSSWRQPDYQFTRLFQHAIIALLTGLIFLQLGNTVATLQYRVFAIFIVSVIPAIIIAQIEPFYVMARGIYNRESTSKMYHPVVFSLAQTISELPYAVLCSVTYFLIFYFAAGFQYSSDRAGYFFAMFLVTEIFAISLGQAVAALNPSVYLASVWNPFLILIFSLFCGVTIPKPNMLKFWSSWMYWLDPFTYVIGGLTVNELHNLPIQCAQSELAIFTAPTGQTCQDWAGPFVNASGGYLVDQANNACGYCQYSYGDDFYNTLEIKYSERGRDIAVMIAFCVFNIAVTNIASRFLKFANR